MENIIVSFDSNILKVSYTDKKNLLSTQTNLDNAIVDGAHILDEQRFSQAIIEALSNLGVKPKNAVLNFLTTPESIYTFYMTVSKDMTDIDSAIMGEARKKLENVSIDEIYYSYQKIAPFVYQFTGVKKRIIEDYLEISNITKIPIQSVIPWLFLFPKILSDNDPCIFITKANNKEIVALSEFNGIYYTGLYDDAKTSPNDIERLVNELSIYKRVNPIKRIFLLDYEQFNPGPNFVVSQLPVPVNALVDNDMNKLHILFNFLINKDNSFLFNNTNLINLLQMPAIAASNKSILKIGAIAALIMILGAGGLLALGKFGGKPDKVDVAQKPNESQVLSEQDEAKESTSQAEETKKDIVDPKDLKKEDLKIRVENGAGIPGIAARTQGDLEEFGYVVTGIGNYEEENRENTLLKFKNSKAAYKVLLSEDLKKDYELVVEDGLAENVEYDVLLVLGKN